MRRVAMLDGFGFTPDFGRTCVYDDIDLNAWYLHTRARTIRGDCNCRKRDDDYARYFVFEFRHFTRVVGNENGQPKLFLCRNTNVCRWTSICHARIAYFCTVKEEEGEEGDDGKRGIAARRYR